MKGKWTKVKEDRRHGVAIYNFLNEGNHRLNLSVGDVVYILEEFDDDWYYGFTIKNRNLKGIFPQSFVKSISSDKSQSPLIEEMTCVLREWGNILKQLYINHSSNFKDIERRIYDLISLRSEILSGTLPQDQLREVKHKVASKIDFGNHLLGLDLVVRDESCNILNPESTSTIQLYQQHLRATDDIRKHKNDENRAVTNKILQQQQQLQYQQILNTSQYSTYSLFVSLRNFVCKMNDDAELLISLYDMKENLPFTENYVVRWGKEGFVRDISQFSILRVLFKDLGSRDLARERVYLVCHVIRIGPMDSKDSERDNRRASHISNKKSYNVNTESMRRPFGVAALDITLYLNGKIECDEDREIYVAFVPCEKENLDQTLKRVLNNKEVTQKDTKGHGLWYTLKVLRGDLKQVREENPHLVMGNIALARKMGFPEVIMPGDVRNDLYITLVQGEFTKGAKSTDKNIQVTVTVCNEKGVALPNVIYLGGGVDPLSEYKSVIYYHEDKPKWNEIFKVAVPIEEFKTCHLKLTYKHRSSNEAKDKSEKPFGMSFMKLMLDNGTTLPDKTHSLLVYRYDYKKYEEGDLSYLKLPWTNKTDEIVNKNVCPGYVLSSKDIVLVTTQVCSTKLTQNLDLLGLLNWAGNPDGLDDSLRALTNVDGEEVVKFLQDVLDSLFNILMKNFDRERYDDQVFECLLFTIELVSNRKYQHFEPVLDVYIEESFSATLAYKKLISVLKKHIDKANTLELNKDLLLRIMKSLQYCVRFIVRSRLLYSELNEGRGQDEFEESMKSLLGSIIELMCHNTDTTLLIQGACLKYLPLTIPDILKVFSATQLSSILSELVNRLPANRLLKQKMMTVNDLVKGPLFQHPDSRSILLPIVTQLVKDVLQSREEERTGVTLRRQTRSVEKLARVLGACGAKLIKPNQSHETELELCLQILNDIMELLFRQDIGCTTHDTTEVMKTILRTVIQTSISYDRNRDSPVVMGLVVIMLSIFRQMSAFHFDTYIKHFRTNQDVLDFLMEILLVFKDLVSRPVFARDWCEMIMLQNSVILKSLRYFSHTIRDKFFNPFEHQAWNNFFHCAIAFLTQPALQLETFSQNKRARIVSKYKDMRRETAFEIRSMWFNLGQWKIQFVPGLVGSMLDMTLTPESELRKATIPIFFDMMQCEYYSTSEIMFSRRDSTDIKGHFPEFENEMISKLDVLYEGGRGDEEYKNLFKAIMTGLCEKHSSLKIQGVKFVKIVTRLMERLLQYRSIITDENKENRMSCTVSLLDFYSEINRKEMYIRYVNKLCGLHIECDNYTEAAFTLKLHTVLLSWSEKVLSPHLRSQMYPDCRTHEELKEELYKQIINYFDQGKMWECALDLCKELKEQYEERTFDYYKLSLLFTRMAEFYEKIMTELRPEPEYFRVSFYGRGFPPYLQNKTFVYRGKEYERLSDFCNRTLNQHPNAELMNKLEPPGEDIMESNSQYLQINKVNPVMDERKYKFIGKNVSEQILKYYKVNDVQKFQYSRPVNKQTSDNEFGNLWLERTVLVTSYPLPGILMWFPVTHTKTYMVSPLETAIETMSETNDALRQLIIQYNCNKNLILNPLTLKLHGILDAAVMGGVVNYEKAFFTSEYEASHPDDSSKLAELKRLIAVQIPLLQVGLQVHRERAPSQLHPMQFHMEERFIVMQNHVESNYGKQECDLRLNSAVTSARRQLSTITTTGTENNRSSISSLSPSESNSMSSHLKSLKSIRTSSSPLKVKDKRKSKTSSARDSTGSTNNSQWYTSGPDVSVIVQPGTTQPVIELRQELTPQRPLRSEVERERRLSRPSSGHFTNFMRINNLPGSIRFSQASIQSSNRDSTGTTESTTSEEDQLPPPLPAKQREMETTDVIVLNNHVVNTPPTPPPKKTQKIF